MNILLLGRGKTGSLIADVAGDRGHRCECLRSADNPNASALTAKRLSGVDMVMDFTTAHSVVENIRACVAAMKNMVVGTTGWYAQIPQMRELVEKYSTGLLYGANFSIGVNLFFDAARSAAAALEHQYAGHIFERHHAHKRDAPSGTAVTLRELVRDASSHELEITSFREGDVVGLHELVLESPHDTIYLCHDAKSRRGFAEGAVRGAEWLAGKRGVFEFKDVWRQMR